MRIQSVKFKEGPKVWYFTSLSSRRLSKNIASTIQNLGFIGYYQIPPSQLLMKLDCGFIMCQNLSLNIYCLLIFSFKTIDVRNGEFLGAVDFAHEL